MNSECKIKDDDEILEEEKNRFNFRRFTPEEIQKKYSPFERISKKKEISFLFQKKKYSPKLEGKVSLEDIIHKMDSLDISGNCFSPHTPSYLPSSPYSSSSPFSRPPTPMPELQLEEAVLKEDHKINLDG